MKLASYFIWLGSQQLWESTVEEQRFWEVLMVHDGCLPSFASVSMVRLSRATQFNHPFLCLVFTSTGLDCVKFARYNLKD
jgi:hypothetical protein